MNNYAAAAIFSVFLLIAGIAGFYYNEWEPVAARRTELEAKIDDHKAQLQKLRTLDADIKKYKEKIEKLKEEKGKLQTESIPLDTVVPKLLDSTETVANKFKVKFQDIRISPLVRAEDWSELPIEMTVLGSFNDISCFLNVMEQRKIVNLAAGSMNVSVSSEIDKDTKSPTLSVTLSAKVYIL